MIVRKVPRRGGKAVVELAVLLPLLAFLFLVAVDWGRIFYFSITVGNCARNGAMNAYDPYSGIEPAHETVEAAALADAQDLSPPPTVTTAKGTDSQGNYVDCTVQYTFRTITNFPLIPNSTLVTRTVRVYSPPRTPR